MSLAPIWARLIAPIWASSMYMYNKDGGQGSTINV